MTLVLICLLLSACTQPSLRRDGESPQSVIFVTNTDAMARMSWSQSVTLDESSDFDVANSPYLMYSQRMGDDWTGPSVLVQEDDEIKNIGRPQLVSDSLGRLHLVWFEMFRCVGSGPCVGQVNHKMRSKEGVWGEVTDLRRTLGVDVMPTGVTATPDGSLHLVGSDIYSNVMHTWMKPDGTWQPSQELEAGSEGFDCYGTCAPQRPSVAVGSDGTMHAVWGMNWPATGVLRYAKREKGDGWTKPIDLFKFGDGIVTPMLVSNQNGDLKLFVEASWDGNSITYTEPSGPQILGDDRRTQFFLFHSNTDRWSVPESVPGPDQGASWPAAAVDNGGRLAVIWSVISPRTGSPLALSTFRLADDFAWSPAFSSHLDKAIYGKRLLALNDGKLLLVGVAMDSQRAGSVIAVEGSLAVLTPTPSPLPTSPTPPSLVPTIFATPTTLIPTQAPAGRALEAETH